MPQQRMKYQWFRDVPRNVTRREYDAYQLRLFAAAGSGVLAAMMAFAALLGISMQSSRQLDAVAAITVTEAAALEQNQDLVKLEGYLVADAPLTLPGGESRQVIRGRVTVSARPGSSSSTTDEDDDSAPLSATLLDWQESAEAIFLTDKDTQIPLAFDVVHLPLKAEAGPLDAKVLREGDSARTRRPVAVEYGDRVLPLPLEEWGSVTSAIADVERQVLPDGQSVVIVAGLETRPEGNVLVDPLGDRLTVLLGTEEDIRSKGQRMRSVLAVLWIPLAIFSGFMGRSALQLRQSFVERSNQSEP